MQLVESNKKTEGIDKINEIPRIGKEMIRILKENNISTLEDLAKASDDQVKCACKGQGSNNLKALVNALQNRYC